MFISVILSAAPPKIFNGFKLTGAESKDPRGFFLHPYGIREFSQYLACS